MVGFCCAWLWTTCEDVRAELEADLSRSANQLEQCMDDLERKSKPIEEGPCWSNLGACKRLELS